MRKFAIIALMFFSLDALSQNNLVNTDPVSTPTEIYSGTITGQIKTTDGQPAVSVTVYIAENQKFAVTDEQGRFYIRNLKDGNYTLEISMAAAVVVLGRAIGSMAAPVGPPITTRLIATFPLHCGG